MEKKTGGSVVRVDKIQGKKWRKRQSYRKWRLNNKAPKNRFKRSLVSSIEEKQGNKFLKIRIRKKGKKSERKLEWRADDNDVTCTTGVLK